MSIITAKKTARPSTTLTQDIYIPYLVNKKWTKLVGSIFDSKFGIHCMRAISRVMEKVHGVIHQEFRMWTQRKVKLFK